MDPGEAATAPARGADPNGKGHKRFASDVRTRKPGDWPKRKLRDGILAKGREPEPCSGYRTDRETSGSVKLRQRISGML
jgi:hypothetical protein